MRPAPTLKVLGVILMVLSFSMLPPVVVNQAFDQNNAEPFWLSFLITLTTGFCFWLPVRNTRKTLRTKDGFVVVVMIWLTLALFGAIPYMLSNGLHLTLTEAFFESMSGFTTTGATVITGLDSLPKSILYYRQQSHFFGGIGIIVLAVAVLPLIGVGGMQLFQAEAGGPWRENKLTPRITETAKVLWLIYIGLNAACILSYRLCGMDWFNSICYGFSTMSTGGFAPHDASIAYYQSSTIYLICIFFMIIGGASFALHFKALFKLHLKAYFRDPEFKTYMYFLIAISLIAGLTLIASGFYKNEQTAMISAFFQVVSFGTTTGFTLASDYAYWPLFLPVLLSIAGLLGGCAGSTSGGIKVLRGLLVFKQASREVSKVSHPNGVFVIKIGDQVITDTALGMVWGFCAAFLILLVVFALMLMGLGVDVVTAFSAVTSCISCVGPGIGAISQNYADLPAASHWVLAFAMLIGRLEVFTVLVLFTPTFWKH